MKHNYFIIGGGVAGLSAAYALLLEGHEVTLADHRQSGQSSWAGAGILSPLLPWDYDDHVNRLALEGMQSWPGWASEIERLSGADPEYWGCGMEVRAVKNPEAALDWCRHHAVPAELAEKSRLWLPSVGQLRNPRLIAALTGAVRALGGRVLPDCEITGMRHEGGRILSALAGREEYKAGSFVWAGGAWAGLALGDIAPVPNIRPVRGQMLLYAPGSHALSHILYKDGLYLVPRRDGHLLAGSTIEYAGFDASTTSETFADLHEAACNLLPELHAHHPIHAWAGLRPGSPDNMPVIDRHPNHENLWVNTGHFRYGVTMAPASSRLLVELCLNQSPHIDPTPYSWQAALGRGWQVQAAC